MVRRVPEALLLNVSTRRTFLQQGAALGGALLLDLGAGVATYAQAREQRLRLRTLVPSEAAALTVLGETLVPGCIEAGFVHYIDHQLGVAPAHCLFMAKYVGVAPPYLDFYRAGLAAIETLSRRRFSQSTAHLSATEAQALITSLSAGNISGWEGPPPGLLYFVLRNDAVDVSFGTRAGFERLGVPYMPHIEPPTPWGT